MTEAWHSRSNGSLAGRGVALALLSAVTLAGCGDSSAEQGAGTDELSQSTRAELEERLGTIQAVPELDHPGPPIDISSLRGKKLFLIPFDATSEFNKIEAEGTVEAGEAAGLEVQVFSSTGSPTSHQTGMDLAIAEGADAILLQGPDPRLLRPQVAAAAEAGIPIILDHTLDVEHADAVLDEIEGLTIGAPLPATTANRYLADFVALDSDGTGKSVYLNIDDIGDRGVQMFDAYEDQLATVCPSCENTKASITFADLDATTTNAVQNALRKDPDTEYVVAQFDVAVPAIQTALKAVGNTTTKIVTFNGTQTILRGMGPDSPVVADVGEPISLLGYASVDQAMRLLLGEEPVDQPTLMRMFQADNAGEVGDETDSGYGDLNSFKGVYKSLWGVG